VSGRLAGAEPITRERWMMSNANIVSGSLSSWAELEQDESFLRDWFKEQPSRLGLGDLDVADADPVQDDDGNPAFIASNDDTYFSVDVRLGEMEASGGFQLLDNWARNRVRHLDKTHVAVLVTENVGDRYRTTLETLTEHLPLIVVELQVWKGETEAILVPHVALASEDVDLSDTPAAKAAAVAPAAATESTDEATEVAAQVDDDTSETADEAAPEATAEAVPENKDDTGVADPWGPSTEAQPEEASENGNGKRLLTKIGG
jgi:hypothetical protein